MHSIQPNLETTGLTGVWLAFQQNPEGRIENPEKWCKIGLKNTKFGWKSIKYRNFEQINHTPGLI